MGREEWRQLAQNKPISPHGPHFSPHSTAKTNDKSTNPNGTSAVALASVYSEKTHLKKFMIMIIIIMNKSQETTVFGGRQKLTSAMKQRPEK